MNQETVSSASQGSTSTDGVGWAVIYSGVINFSCKHGNTCDYRFHITLLSLCVGGEGEERGTDRQTDISGK